MKKVLLILVLFSSFLWAAEITFTFANVTITGESPGYFEFDVMAHSDVEGTLLGTNLFYINYNSIGFGSSVASAGKITVTKGTLVEGGSPPFDYYSIINTTDNTSSRFAVTTEYNYPANPEFGNALPTTPTQLMHIKIEIADENQTADLSFEQPLMVGQEYESDNSSKYSPVVASDTENSLLTTSALEEITGAGIPQEYALQQNYPNPFNPSTTLRFDIPEIAHDVQLAVYDVLGQEVARLFDGDVHPGAYSYQWNGTNSAGSSMPSGVYFAILHAPEFTQTIKMMLIK